MENVCSKRTTKEQSDVNGISERAKARTANRIQISAAAMPAKQLPDSGRVRARITYTSASRSCALCSLM